MRASRLLRCLLSREIQHTLCLSPAGYSTVHRDPVPLARCPWNCAPPSLAGSDSSAPPYPSRVATWYDGGRHHPLPSPAPVPRVGRSAGSDRQSLRRYHRPNRWRWGRGLSGSTCRQAGVRRLPPFDGVATAYPCQTTEKSDAAGYAVGLPAYPSRWPDAPFIRIPRAKRSGHRRGERKNSNAPHAMHLSSSSQ